MAFLALALLAALPNEALHAPVAAHWDATRSQVIILESKPPALVYFDAALRPLRRRPVASLTSQSIVPYPQTSVARGPAGRPIEIDTDAGRVSLGLLPWESAPVVVRGNGWQTVRWRSSAPTGGWAEWEIEGGMRRRFARVEVDRWDPLTKRIYIEPVADGVAIRYRLPPLRREYPRRPWGEWVAAASP